MAGRLEDGSWEIQGRRVGFPVRIADASLACAVHLVRTDRAEALVAGTPLDLVSVAGRTPLVVMLADYRTSDLGSYHEVGVALLARHRGRTGAYVHQLPVTETFTLEAGRTLWGLPKWLAGADLAIVGDHADCTLTVDDRLVLAVTLRTVTPRLAVPVRVALTALAPCGDEVRHTRVRVRARGIRLGVAASIDPGIGHLMADELRVLGLPRRPLLTLIVDELALELDPAVPVAS